MMWTLQLFRLGEMVEERDELQELLEGALERVALLEERDARPYGARSSALAAAIKRTDLL